MQLDKEAAYQAEITFTAVSMTCGKSGKHPLQEAIKTYLQAAKAPEQPVGCSCNGMKMWEAEEAAHERTIEQRDKAQDAADDMASLILGEPVDWMFHDEKWKLAIEKLESELKRESVAQLPSDMNELELDTLNRIRELTKHGYKTIDIKVRKDGKETWFEGDFLSGTRKV